MLEGFVLPARGTARAFAEAQAILYAEDPALQPFFWAIQNHVSFGTAVRNSSRPALPLPASLGRSLRSLDLSSRRRTTSDVLLVGVWKWQRPQEDRLLGELTRSLLSNGALVQILIHRGSRFERRFDDDLKESVRDGRLLIRHPEGLVGRLGSRLSLVLARGAALETFRRIRDILEVNGIALSEEAIDPITWCTARIHDWRAVEQSIEYGAALVRCHWLPLSSSVARSAIRRGRRVTTFQQGVVSHSIDVPVVADRYVAFGSRSAELVQTLDREFFTRVGGEPLCSDYFPAGSLTDVIRDVHAAVVKPTVLVVDQSNEWSTSYYGLEEPNRALGDLARRIAEEQLARVVVRLHPAAEKTSIRDRFEALHPDIEISLPSERSLEDDLARATVVVGLFSGALPVAAASGIPVVLLGDPSSFRTPDLEPFEEARLDPASAYSRVVSLLRNPDLLDEAREEARAMARNYFRYGGNADMGEIATRLVADASATSWGQSAEVASGAGEGEAPAEPRQRTTGHTDAQKKPRIGLYSTMDGLPWGGSEILWSMAVPELLDRGIEVSVSYRRWPAPARPLRELQRQGVRVDFRPVHLPAKAARILARRFRRVSSPASRWLDRAKPDLVLISAGYHMDRDIVEVADACRARSIPYLLLVHAASPYDWYEGELVERFRDAYVGAVHPLFVSRENQRIIETSIARSLGHARVVDNPLLVRCDEPIAWPDEDRWALACVGRLHFRSKGQDLVLETLARSGWKERPLVVRFFGEDQGSRAQIEELIELYGLAEQAEVAGFEPDRQAIWRDHHAQLLPSRYDGMPMTTLEAMWCGRVPIVTACGRNPDLIEDGATGYLASAPTVDAVDETLERAWRDRARWKEIGARASRSVRASYGSDPVGAFVELLVGSLATRR